MGKLSRACAVGAVVVLSLVFWRIPAYGAIGASATITPSQLGPSSYEYAMTLTNTGTTPIGTFWFAWIPGYDLLPRAPTSIISPSGWTGTNAPDFFGVASAQWVNTVTPLQPGQSLSCFKFDTPDAPDVIGGTSQFFGTPVERSYVYIGAPQTDLGFPFTPVTVTPEPAALTLLLATPAFLLRRRSRQ
jgi:hypothetical protein